MPQAQLEPIQTQTLDNVTGGGWLDMLSGGKLNIASMLGGGGNGAFGLNKNGDSKGLSEGIAGLFGFGNSGIKTVEGSDHQGFGG